MGILYLEQKESAGGGQSGVATLYMDSTWWPQDDVQVTVSLDGAALGYISTYWRVGYSSSATRNGADSLFVQMADLTNRYPNGTVGSRTSTSRRSPRVFRHYPSRSTTSAATRVRA